MTYEIMHNETCIATISDRGRVQILNETFFPYALYLEEGTEVDTLVNNLENFYYWCASRLLTLQRVYAKEILNSIGATQRTTDKDRAFIALQFHCLSLTDVYWVRAAGEALSFAEINLYSHAGDNSFVDVSLRGQAKKVADSSEAAPDISTVGTCPKAWIYQDGYYLLKDGDAQDVAAELLASNICDCFDVPHARYTASSYEGILVSKVALMTSPENGIETREAFDIYAQNHEIDAERYIVELDAHGYYMMNIIDYLTGNTDRHWGNWGLLIDNRTNRPVRLHDLIDFNRAFRAYDTIDGSVCQTHRVRSMTQREAAIEAVQKNGLHELKEADPAWFHSMESIYEMYLKRLELLRGI